MHPQSRGTQTVGLQLFLGSTKDESREMMVAFCAPDEAFCAPDGDTRRVAPEIAVATDDRDDTTDRRQDKYDLVVFVLSSVCRIVFVFLPYLVVD